MKKHLSSNIVFVISIALLNMALFNINYMKMLLPEHIFAGLLLVFFESLIFWLIISFSKYIFMILCPIIFTVSALADYFIKYYQVDMTYSTIALVFKTNMTESVGLIESELIIKLCAAFIMGVILAIIRIKYIKHDGIIKTSIATVIFIIIVFIVKPIEKDYSDKMLKGGFQLIPVAYLEKTYHYIRFERNIAYRIKNKTIFANNNIIADREKKTVILVLSDALRTQNMGIYGYERNNTPLMVSNELIQFPPAFACADTTFVSVPCILTRATRNDPFYSSSEQSIISLFKKAGYYTAWISNQGFMGRSDLTSTEISKEADYSYFNSDFNRLGAKILDRGLIQKLSELLEQNHDNTFIILHMIGSHWPYEYYYPESSKVYNPICTQSNPTKCERNELINSYDNTVIENDFVLNAVIEMVKDKNALVLFTSDHGELLFENGRTLHGSDTIGYKEVRYVPLLMKAFGEPGNSEKISIAVENAADKIPVSHDNIFHSLADCSGISSAYINQKLSICSKDIIPAVDLFE